MDADLAEKLHRRVRRLESVDAPAEPASNYERQHTLARDFSRKQIQQLRQTFDQYDTDRDKSLDFNEVKCLLEKLGMPQTHLHLKQLIKQVDDDHDGKISFGEFLLIFQQAVTSNVDREKERSTILCRLYSMLLEIDVAKEGVSVARSFFEAKVAAVNDGEKFHREIREEQDQRRRLEEEKLRRKTEFQHRLALFQTV